MSHRYNTRRNSSQSKKRNKYLFDPKQLTISHVLGFKLYYDSNNKEGNYSENMQAFKDKIDNSNVVPHKKEKKYPNFNNERSSKINILGQKRKTRSKINSSDNLYNENININMKSNIDKFDMNKRQFQDNLNYINTMDLNESNEEKKYDEKKYYYPKENNRTTNLSSFNIFQANDQNNKENIYPIIQPYKNRNITGRQSVQKLSKKKYQLALEEMIPKKNEENNYSKSYIRPQSEIKRGKSLDIITEKKQYERLKRKAWYLKYTGLKCSKKEVLKALISKRKSNLLKSYIIVRKNNDIHVYLQYNNYFNYNKGVNPIFNINEIEPEIEQCRDWTNLYLLCMETKDYITNLEKEFDELNKKNNIKKQKYEIVSENRIYIMNEITNKKIILGKLITRSCIWLYGPSGSGKSYIARKSFENEGYYDKQLNEGWFLYDGQKTVIVEIGEEYNKQIGKWSKLWTENYTFEAQDENKKLVPNYKKIIFICSQNFDDYFKIDAQMKMTLKPRFIFIKLEDRKDQLRVQKILLKA